MYRFGLYFGSRNYRTLARELDMREEKVDEKSRMVSRFLT